MQLDIAALQQRLMEQAAGQRSALELRIRSVDRVKEELLALQANSGPTSMNSTSS